MYQNITRPLTFIALLVNCCLGIAQTDLPWKTSTAEKEGMDQSVLNELHRAIKNDEYGLIDRFLVIRNDKVVFDKKYIQDYQTIASQYDTTNYQYDYDHPDWHPYYKGTSLHTLQSVTKSVTALLLGIAWDQGQMIPVDSAAMSLFQDYSFDLSDPRKQSITLHDLLTMQGGIEWDEASYDEADNDCVVMELSEDWIQYVLDKQMATDPGTQFNYNSGISVLLGKIVRISTGMTIDKWAEQKLFKPLGITDYYWKKTPKGEIDTEGGLYLSTYALAKIGYLMLNDGVWNGQQIVSKKWVQQSIQPHVQFSEQSGYGYQWWVPEVADGKPKVFAGNGYGGQFLMVAPEEDLIVVFNGWNIHDQPEKSSWVVLQDIILPSLK